MMNKSIENIWKDGFTNEELVAPRINELYNQKSISAVEKIIKEFENRVLLILPISVGIFLFNIVLDNDNAVFWGIVSAIPCLVWFFLGKKQVKSLVNIDYQSNCYEYLLSIKERINAIHRFNKKIGISSVPIILFPMVVYTYFNQQGKTIGEIFGVGDMIPWPTASIFLVIPIVTLIAYAISKIEYRVTGNKFQYLESLINEMKDLQ